jgi:hypothetical protein
VEVPAIGAILLGLLFTFGGYRVPRLAVRLASAFLCASAAEALGLHPVSVGLSLPLGWLLGNAVYWILVFVGGAAVGFWAAGAVGLVAGAAAAVLFERPLAILFMAWLGARLISSAL